MRLLGVLHLLGVVAGRIRQELAAVALLDLGPGRRQGGVGQRGRVRPHVGDVAGLVQALGRAHGHGRREAQLAAGLLLEGGGDEGRRGSAAVRTPLDRAHREGRPGQIGGQDLGPGLVEHGHPAPDLAVLAEVLAAGQAVAVQADHRGPEGAAGIGGPGLAGLGGELALEVPVGGADEAHALALALHHQAGAHALDPPDAAARPHLLHGHRGQRAVAVDAVEQAAGLLGVDQAAVDVARVLDGVADGLGGDLVEHHALYGHGGRRVEHLEQVPGDGLALAILICGQVELGGPLQLGLQPLDDVLLVPAHHVERLEVVVDVDAQDLPLALVGLGHVGRVAGKVPDVAHRGVHGDRPQVGGGRHAGVARGSGRRQEPGDGLGLGRGLHDD